MHTPDPIKWIFALAGWMLITIIACKDGIPGTSPIMEQPFTSVTPVRAQEMIDKHAGIRVIDVRTPIEYHEGHITQATLADVSNEDEFRQQISQWKKDDIFLLYCRSGTRSKRAMRIMEDAGFSYVYDVDGGYIAWPKY